MFRIRRIYDDVLPISRQMIADVQQILREQFPGVSEAEVERLPERLSNPFPSRFVTLLYVAENERHTVLGFALVLFDPEVHFTYLDYLATSKQIKGRGIGAALYERVRDEARTRKSKALFFECAPDEPEYCANAQLREQNAQRLKFYETYGVRPVLNPAYQTPISPGTQDGLPVLMYDDLDTGQPLRASYARKVVRAILERKYGDLCSPSYVELVVNSFRSDPVPLREYRYRRSPAPRPAPGTRPVEQVAVFVNDKHEIHHVRERGYVEAPARIRVILSELEASGLAEVRPVKNYPLRHLSEVHDPELIQYLKRACENVPPGKSVYPYVFPIRNATRPPKELSVLAGYYCIDTFTPINRNVLPAAQRAVDCALSAADEILGGRRIAYALVRPPGHHAERRVFGGFCYFNNAAVAAHYLSRVGRVVILDIDYHHGNGQQDIFYRRSDVFTVSLHGDPSFAYPYFTGFEDEIGEAAGEGFNMNLPLPEVLDGPQYRRALQQALTAIRDYRPTFLVVALGLDPAKGDPTGTWLLRSNDFELNGRLIGSLGLPTLVVQEGGYRTRTLGINARAFFKGLVAAAGGT